MKNRTRYSPIGQRDLIAIRLIRPDFLGDCKWKAVHQDADLALVEAQSFALDADDEMTLEVVRRPIGIGREAVLYRVVRDADGVVLTHVVDLED